MHLNQRFGIGNINSEIQKNSDSDFSEVGKLKCSISLIMTRMWGKVEIPSRLVQVQV